MRMTLDEAQPETSRLRSRLRQLLDSSYPAPAAAPPEAPWVPAADIHATADAVVVTLEVPGVRLQEVEAVLDDRVLTVSGRRPRVRDEAYFQAARPAGPFSRSFALGFAPRDIQASLDLGVLTLTLRR